MKGFPDLPPIWLLGALALSWVLNALVPLVRFDIAPVGSVLFWAGLALIAWAVLWFFRRKTPVEPHHVPKVLLVEGPFRLSRNPIYLGLVLILTGVTLGWGGLSGMITVPLLAVILHRRFVLVEEAGLRAAFGPAAEDYFKATRRWI